MSNPTELLQARLAAGERLAELQPRFEEAQAVIAAYDEAKQAVEAADLALTAHYSTTPPATATAVVLPTVTRRVVATSRALRKWTPEEQTRLITMLQEGAGRFLTCSALCESIKDSFGRTAAALNCQMNTLGYAWDYANHAVVPAATARTNPDLVPPEPAGVLNP